MQSPKTVRNAGSRAASSRAPSAELAPGHRHVVSLVKPDVFVRGDVLRFRSPRVAERGVLLERAKLYLQTLRAGIGDGRLSFGGAVNTSGVDVERSLRSYYPALGTALLLGGHEELAPGVLRFIDELSLPVDLRALAERSAGVSRPAAQSEELGPLGTTSFVASRYKEQVDNKLDAGHKVADGELELNDSGVDQIFGDKGFYSNKPTFEWFDAAVPEDRLRALRLWVRGKERGAALPLTEAQLNKKELPASNETVSALRRAAHVFGLDQSKILLGGKPLSEQVERTPLSEQVERTPRRKPEATGPIESLASSELSTRSPMSKELHSLLSARDPSAFLLSDGGLELLLVSKGGDLNNIADEAGVVEDPEWHAAFLNAWTRAIQVGLTTGDSVRKYLKGPQFPLDTLESPAFVTALMRLLKQAELRPSKVELSTGERLHRRPEFRRLYEGALAPVPSRGSSSRELAAAGTSERLRAFEQLMAPGERAAELPALVAAIQDGLESGKLAPVEFAALSEAERKRVLDVLLSLDHLGATTVLWSLLVKGGDGELAGALKSLGYSEKQVAEWTGYAQELAALASEDRAWALRGLRAEQPDFLLLPLRLELAKARRLTASDVEDLVARYRAYDPSEVAATLIEGAVRMDRGSQDAVKDLLRADLDDGSFLKSDFRYAVSRNGLTVVYPELEAQLSAAVDAIAKADPLTRPGAEEKLVELLKAHAAALAPDELAEDALLKLHQHDLRQVLPLGQVDEELGGVASRVWRKEGTPRAEKKVTVGGIELAFNEDPLKDVRAIPRKNNADLVPTETTSRNLRLMAAEWVRGRPVLLEGPTSAGKTSMVRYLAWLTGTPYRRINLSYDTDVSDLIGRYVGGEKKYTLEQLEKKTDGELKYLAEEYGLEPELSREEHVAGLFEAQKKARWVDGPIVKAMRRGEVLLLDEVNLAKPEVLERLNSLFDNSKNLILTEHRNEPVTPHESFRVFATMNPASYAGRAKLSKAMRSRWTTLEVQGLTQADITQILKARYGGRIPEAELAKLVAAHDSLARAADDGNIGRASGGMAYSLRNLNRVADRFVRYRGMGLSDAALMRREMEEIYRGGLFDPDDLKSVDDMLNTAMPYSGPGFYDNLEVKETNDTFTIGDVTLRKLNTGHPLVPDAVTRLVLTDRTKQVLYRLAKALDNGENVGLVGERASGKTAIAEMLAGILGQPFYRQLISGSTDAMGLVGGYDNLGWKDGLLLEAGRPENVPGMLLLDELNLGASSLLERLNSVLDDERKLVLAEREGDEIRMHPQFRFVAAMNPPTKEYGGRNKLSVAMQNRLTQIYVPDLNSPEEQKEILRAIGARKGVPEAVADALVDLHHWVADGYERGKLGKELREQNRPELSIRQLLNALDLVAYFEESKGLGDAFLLAVEVYYASRANAADNAKVLAKAREIAK